MPSPVSSPQTQCLAGDSWERVYGVCVEGLYLGDLEVTFVPGGMVWSCVGRLTPGGSRQGLKGGAGAGFPGAGPLQLNHKHPLGPPQAKGKGKMISDWRTSFLKVMVSPRKAMRGGAGASRNWSHGGSTLLHGACREIPGRLCPLPQILWARGADWDALMPPMKLPLAARPITSRGRPSRGFGSLCTPAAARAPGAPAHLSGTGDRSAPPPIPCAGTRDPCAPAGSGPRSAPPACPPRTRRSSRLIRSGPRTRRAKGSGPAH